MASLKSLILTAESKPEEALELPDGHLALSSIEVSFTPANVVECAKLIIDNGGHPGAFYTQAEIIEYAGNNLDWGTGEGYSTF